MEVKNEEKAVELFEMKLRNFIERKSHSCISNLQEIEKTKEETTDFIAPLGSMGTLDFNANGSLFVNAAMPDGVRPFRLHDNALSQLGAKLGIPTAYLRKISRGSAWERELAAKTLNEHIIHESDRKLLVRAVADEARAFLSDRYRRLDSVAIYREFIKELNKYNARVITACCGDIRTYIEALVPKANVIETPNNGKVVYSYGIRISNSDFGSGALVCSVYSMNLVCMNGLVLENKLRQIHLGKELPDDISVSDETYEYDTKTQASLIKDITANVFGGDYIENHSSLIRKASAIEVDMEKEIKLLPSVGFSKGDCDSITKIVLNNKEEDGLTGSSTLWKLTQAITAHARECPELKMREKEEIAGKYMLNRIAMFN